jgi:AraC-like DNA-binding protein
VLAYADVLPVAMPGLRAARYHIDTLYAGVKEEWSVVEIEAGESTFFHRGRIESSAPGDIQVKRPGDVHRTISRNGVGVFQVIAFPKELVERISMTTTSDGLFVANDPRAASFRRLHAAVRTRADRLTLETAVTEAITTLGDLRGAAPESRPVRRAIELLRERLTEQVTLDDLAAHADLDKFHLCRAFREQIGMPPHAYLTHLRISRAKQLLKSGVRPSAVAPQVGLYDQSQLNRHFRRIVGVTPGAYARGA